MSAALPRLSRTSQSWVWPRLGILIGLGLLAGAWPLRTVRAHSGDTWIVEMTEEGFVPDRLQVLAGDSLEFRNLDTRDHWPASDVHPTHELYPELDARRPLGPGESWSFGFHRLGVWGFHDHLNPQFTAAVVVLPDSHPASDEAGPSADEPSGLGRYFAAVKRYYARVFEAIRLFLVEAFPSRAAAVQPTPVPAAGEVRTEFRAPAPAELETVMSEMALACAPADFDCLAGFFRGQTDSYGPTLTIELLLRLREDGRVNLSVDEHQLAHQIGRQTAESFGINESAFLLCPMAALNGGCQHGFFEYVLGKTTTTAEAADLICQSLDEEYSAKFRFYCYHGVGHGVMMAAAYDLQRALTICDTFATYTAQDGCWQGVFMENVNAGMRGEARAGVFSSTDPLAPCNQVAEKYQHECYVNHAGYLMTFFGNDVGEASLACLGAAADYIPSCLQSIGLMVTNPVWQPELFGELGSHEFVEVAWGLCQKFPAEWREQCVIGGIDNIHNFDEFDLGRAIRFCQAVSPQYADTCYRRMGLNLRANAVDLADVRRACGELPAESESICLAGADLQP